MGKVKAMIMADTEKLVEWFEDGAINDEQFIESMRDLGYDLDYCLDFLDQYYE